MWLFTKYGFFSAVCARKGDGNSRQPVDLNRIMVRARVAKHLELLKQRFSNLLGQCEIRESTNSDYAYRIFVQKSPWAQVMAALAKEIDYDNFKDKVVTEQGQTDYENSLHQVWSVMLRLQQGT